MLSPIFEQLKQRLGELTPEDEARLLSEDNNANLDFVIFTTSVEDSLEEFEQVLPQLQGESLRQALVDMASRMSEFGLMAQLDAFVSLCQAVQEQCMRVQPETLDQLVAEAIKTWRRSPFPGAVRAHRTIAHSA